MVSTPDGNHPYVGSASLAGLARVVMCRLWVMTRFTYINGYN